MLPFENAGEASLAELKGLETLALPGSHVFLPKNYAIDQVSFSALATKEPRHKCVVPHLDLCHSLQGAFLHYN